MGQLCHLPVAPNCSVTSIESLSPSALVWDFLPCASTLGGVGATTFHLRICCTKLFSLDKPRFQPDIQQSFSLLCNCSQVKLTKIAEEVGIYLPYGNSVYFFKTINMIVSVFFTQQSYLAILDYSFAYHYSVFTESIIT